MGRRKVVEISCDRCPRSELVEDLKEIGGGSLAFEAKYRDPETKKMKTVKWEDLCSTCQGVLARAMERLLTFQKDEVPTTPPPVSSPD